MGYCNKNRTCSSSAEATGELIGNRIAKKFVKPKLVPNANLRNIEEINILPEKNSWLKKL